MSSTLPFGKKAKYYDALYCQKNYEKEIRYLTKMADLSGSVGDFGCGTGGHIEHLKGFCDVTGFDLSNDMIEIARRKHKDIPFICCNVANVHGFIFDHVISIFHVLNYQKSLKELQAFFASAFANLKHGGSFCFDFWNLAGVRHDPPSSRLTEYITPEYTITRTSYPTELKKYQYQIKFVVNIRDASGELSFFENHLMTVFSLDQISYAAKLAGFQTIQFHAWLKDKPLEEEWLGFGLCRK